MKNNKKIGANVTDSQKISISFLGVILVGTLLLMLPITHVGDTGMSFIDALFTATSATCVTGLSVVVTVDTFNIFGQVVIMMLIQIGGIGLMTLVATFMSMMKTKLKLIDKMALKSVLNKSDIFDLKKFLIAIIKYTLIFEIVGALALAIVFVPEYGFLMGMFKSIFISVSAFCNAGFDVIGSTGLIPYDSSAIVMITVMCLIVFGGIGFIVWFEISNKFNPLMKKNISFKQFLNSLSVHTKIVMQATFLLIVIPAIIFFLLEYSAPTMMDMNIVDKILNSLFMSVTLRTAGFATINLADMHIAGQFIMLIVMFIGGSPGGTAGGIKTTTFMVIIVCVVRMLRGKSRTNMYRRHISRNTIVRATAIAVVNLTALFTGVFFLCISEDFEFFDLLFEAVSALATVGLTIGITPYLSVVGKIVIILLMFVGRIGIMTFIFSIIKEGVDDKNIHYAEGHVIVG